MKDKVKYYGDGIDCQWCGPMRTSNCGCIPGPEPKAKPKSKK